MKGITELHRSMTRTVLGLVVGVAVVTACFAKPEDSIAEPKRSATIPWLNPQIPNVTVPAYEGKRYTSRVPDTLDIAERAKLSVNGLTGPVDSNADYEIFWLLRICGNRPCMERDINDQVQVQWQEALPLMRLVSGNKPNMHVEKRWLELLFQQQGPDGLLYLPVNGRPWFNPKGVGQQSTGQFDDFEGDQFTGPMNSGGSLGWIGIYYVLTGDKRYRQAGEKMIDGMLKQVVHRHNYAFFAKGLYGIGEVADPKSPMPPYTKNAILGWNIRYLVKFYQATDYQPALRLAGELTRYLLKYGNILSSDGEWLGHNRHAGWNGGCLLGPLKYALAVGDQELIEWCRKSYEYGKMDSCGEMLTGFFPEYAKPTDQGGETCAVAFFTELAVMFSQAGIADYWGDVDRWTRNHLAECHIKDSKWMYTVFADQPDEKIDPVFASYDEAGEKNVGNFMSWPAINDGLWFYEHPRKQLCMHCCAAEGSLTLFRVWKNILHYQDGKLKVNLLMNRASHWADIDSYIPYEGSVDVKMKKKAELSIRIPEWVKPSEAKCTVNGTGRRLAFEGRYAEVGKVKAKDAVTLTFPIFIRTNKVSVQGKEYTLTRKGNEVIHIEPEGKYSPLYQRNKYRENKARMITVERFLADQKTIEKIMNLY